VVTFDYLVAVAVAGPTGVLTFEYLVAVVVAGLTGVYYLISEPGVYVEIEPPEDLDPE